MNFYFDGDRDFEREQEARNADLRVRFGSLLLDLLAVAAAIGAMMLFANAVREYFQSMLAVLR